MDVTHRRDQERAPTADERPVLEAAEELQEAASWRARPVRWGRRRGGVSQRVLDNPIIEHGRLDDIRRRESRYRRTLAISDMCAAGSAMAVCFNVQADGNLVGPAVLIALPAVVLLSKLHGLYDRDELLLNKTTADEIPKLFQLATLLALVMVIAQSELVNRPLGGDEVLVLWGALVTFTVAGRSIARRLARLRLEPERCLFVGTSVSRDRLTDKLRQNGDTARVVGHMALDGDFSEEYVRARVSVLRDMTKTLNLHRVVIEPSDASPQIALDFVREAKATGLRVSILPRVLEVVGTSIEVDDIDGLTLLGVRRFGLSRSSYASKRAFDIVAAGFGLLVLSPLLLLIALLIKLDSRGPVFYRAGRVGRDGKVFDMWKFRSMVTGADEMRAQLRARNQAAAGLFKIADDPRLTRVGAKLRRVSLDEIPQLINVLRGEMSLVGPRPLIADEDRQIKGLDRRRLDLTPGITGHWQILGSSRLPLSEMVKLDYLYVAGWSLWNDTKILLRTIPYVLGRRGQ